MAYTIRVKPGCMVVGPAPICFEYRGGTVIGEGHMTKQMMEEHIRSGHAEPVNLGADPVPDQIVENPPGTTEMPKISSSEDQIIAIRNSSDPVTAFGKKDPSPGAIVIGDEKTVQQTVTLKESAKVTQQTSIWILDPEDLQGKSLADLNAMVLERDPEMLPFDDEAEAIAQLSMYFRPSK